MALEHDITEWDRKFTKAEERLFHLHDRMDETEKAQTEEFQMEANTGVWDEVTSNDAIVLADTAVGMIANGGIKYIIPGEYRTHAADERVGELERFALGLMAVNDKTLTAEPEMLDLRGGFAFHAVNRGWIGCRAVMYVNDDGDVVPDAVYWDVRYVLWEPNDWVSFERHVSVEEVEAEYGTSVKGDAKGQVVLREIWDDEENGVLITEGEAGRRDWLKPPEKHHIDHRPILILPVGNSPLIARQDGKGMRYVGRDLMFNDRLLLPVQNKILTYLLTMAGRAAKTPNQFKYSGLLSDGVPTLIGDPNEKGAFTPVDTDKGEEIVPGVQPQMPAFALQLAGIIDNKIQVGGIAAVARGLTSGSPAGVTVQGLREAAEKIMKPYITATEKAMAWTVNEWISQFNGLDKKHGIHLEGRDTRGNHFSLKKKPGDIDEKLEVQCEIEPAMLLDKQANLGLAVTAFKEGIVTRDTARELSGLVQDPQSEREKELMEKAQQFAFIEEREMADAFRENGQKEIAAQIEDEIQQRRQLEMEEKQKALQPQQPSGQQGGVQPTATIGRIQDQPNQMERARQRVMKLLGRGQ